MKRMDGDYCWKAPCPNFGLGNIFSRIRAKPIAVLEYLYPLLEQEFSLII
jgi:hypothetical protein